MAFGYTSCSPCFKFHNLKCIYSLVYSWTDRTGRNEYLEIKVKPMRLKTIRYMLYSFIILLTIFSVLVSIYENQYVLPYVTMLGPIIGVIATSVIGLEVWRLRVQDKYIKAHLDALKKQCLEPLKEVILDRFGYFKFDEKSINVVSLESILEDKPSWYDKKSIDANMSLGIQNLKLYKDLDNHKLTKGLPDTFVKIKGLISDNYPIFLRNTIELYKKIDRDKEFNDMVWKNMKDIEKEMERQGMYPHEEPPPETPEEAEEANEKQQKERNYNAMPFAQAIFLIATGEGDNTGMWPNNYQTITKSGYLKQVYQIGARYKNSVEAQNLVVARSTVQNVVNEIIGRISNVLEDAVTLDDNCQIIKENLKNY